MILAIYKCEYCYGFPEKMEKIDLIELNTFKHYTNEELKKILQKYDTLKGEDIIMIGDYIIKKYGEM